MLKALHIHILIQQIYVVLFRIFAGRRRSKIGVDGDPSFFGRHWTGGHYDMKALELIVGLKSAMLLSARALAYGSMHWWSALPPLRFTYNNHIYFSPAALRVPFERFGGLGGQKVPRRPWGAQPP